MPFAVCNHLGMTEKLIALLLAHARRVINTPTYMLVLGFQKCLAPANSNTCKLVVFWCSLPTGFAWLATGHSNNEHSFGDVLECHR